jgi:aminoglycoside phosphotransferase (APT) family kinase protein
MELVPVLPNHAIDEAALVRYLAGRLPGFGGDCLIRQFRGGLSNPTYHLRTADRQYVLRKKPAGVLLPSAHAIDREFAVLNALADSGVPVPRVRLLCDETEVIGQIFYIMDFIEGRVFTDRLLPGCDPAERTAIHDDMTRVLAALHRVDFRAAGLEGFGRPENFAARQVARWSRQYRASAPDENAAMERLIPWLEANLPVADEAAIVHGDYRLGNLVYHPTEPRVVAVLDWELATIGHPIADLAYGCMDYYLPRASGRGFADTDFTAMGIPAERDRVAAYCRQTGRGGIPDWRFFVIFSLFRLAAILAGVHRRAIEGNAADARSAEAGQVFKTVAERAWALAG